MRGLEKILIALSLALSSPKPANAGLKWRVIHEKKWDNTSLMHFAGGFLLSSYIFMDTRHNYDAMHPFSDWRAKPYNDISLLEAGAYSLTMTFLCGFAKEVADGFMWKRGDGFSYRDLAADMAGGLLGTMIAAGISYALENYAKK